MYVVLPALPLLTHWLVARNVRPVRQQLSNKGKVFSNMTLLLQTTFIIWSKHSNPHSNMCSLFPLFFASLVITETTEDSAPDVKAWETSMNSAWETFQQTNRDSVPILILLHYGLSLSPAISFQSLRVYALCRLFNTSLACTAPCTASYLLCRLPDRSICSECTY